MTGEAPQQEYVAQVTIAQKADGTFCIFDPLVPDAKQEFGSLDEAIAGAAEQLSAGDAALTGAPPAEDPQAMWNEMAAQRDAKREV